MTGLDLLTALTKMEIADLRKQILLFVTIQIGEQDQGASFTVNEISATPKILVLS